MLPPTASTTRPVQQGRSGFSLQTVAGDCPAPPDEHLPTRSRRSIHQAGFRSTTPSIEKADQELVLQPSDVGANYRRWGNAAVHLQERPTARSRPAVADQHKQR